MFGREMEHVFVVGVCQERTPLCACAKSFLVERESIELGEQLANRQAPVSVQVVEHPVEALVVWELSCNVSQVCREIDAGARDTQIPQDLTRRHHEGRDQRSCAMTDVFMFASFGFAWFGGDRGMLAFEDLHAGFFVAANHQLALLMQHGSLHVESADRVSFRVEVGIVTVEPIDAAMRFEVGFVENTPDGGTRHRFVAVTIDQRDGQIIDAPVGGDAIVLAGFAGGNRDDFELFIGGKSSGADRSEVRLAVPQDVVAGNAFAKGSRYCDYNPSHWRLGHWRADQPEPAVR